MPVTVNSKDGQDLVIEIEGEEVDHHVIIVVDHKDREVDQEEDHMIVMIPGLMIDEIEETELITDMEETGTDEMIDMMIDVIIDVMIDVMTDVMTDEIEEIELTIEDMEETDKEITEGMIEEIDKQKEEEVIGPDLILLRMNKTKME